MAYDTISLRSARHQIIQTAQCVKLIRQQFSGLGAPRAQAGVLFFPAKSRIVSILGFMSHTVSVCLCMSSQLCRCIMRAATDDS